VGGAREERDAQPMNLKSAYVVSPWSTFVPGPFFRRLCALQRQRLKKPLKFPWQHGRKPCTEAGTGVTLIWELQNRNESSDCHVAAYSLMPLGLAALSLIILAACFVLSDVFAWRHTGSASGPCQSPTVSSLYMSTVPSIPSVINRTGTSSQSLPSPRPSMGIAPILQRDCTLVLRMRCESIIKNVPLLRMNSNWIST